MYKIKTRNYLANKPEEGKPYTVSGFESIWQRVKKKSGIMDVCFRDIRAKAGTDKKREGGDAQVFLGHNSAAMTDKYIRNREGDRVSPNVPIIKK
tara:strand:- start:119 stop:403 length:285 start_codon:yes stop_codon:yes gene_type:complete